MNDLTANPADGGAVLDDVPAVEFRAGGDGPLTPSEAARSVSDQRNKLIAKEREPRGDAAPDPEPKELGAEPDAAPQETEATSETQEANPAEETKPPLELPRSWSKDREESWNKLDRATQEYLLEHDSEASSTVRKAQNEYAEKQKGLAAKEQAIEEARAKYESALPALLETLQNERAGEFADIKNISDLENLSKEDPFRYVQWMARQQKIAAIETELKQVQDRQAQENSKRWQDFASRQDDLVLERIPELADATKASAIKQKAVSVLKDIGFSDDELGQLYNGKSSVSLRDARFQQLVYESTKYRDAQKAAKVAEKKPLPPVQKPGVAPQRGASSQADIKTLEKQLESASGMNAIRIGQKLTQLRREAAR
jgi:hypothetical protein